MKTVLLNALLFSPLFFYLQLLFQPMIAPNVLRIIAMEAVMIYDPATCIVVNVAMSAHPEDTVKKGSVSLVDRFWIWSEY